MRKIYALDPHFATGEATVQPVLLWGRNGRPLREKYTSKTASEAADYIKYVEPKPGTSIVLVLALGAYETYDLNRNGDGFNEFPYRQGVKPTCGCCTADGAWVSAAETLPQHFKSFEQFGKIFKHHQNKDPTRSFGDVLKAFWNPQMHRVELLLGLNNALAPDLAERIANGDYPAVSMGCRIKYDVCTVCGHRAPTRKEYCDHLRFGMRQVTASGLRAGALNPSPKFFDISFVVKPADQTGYMLKKVAEEGAYEVRTSAELGEYLDGLDEKRAALRKVADIDKVVRGVAVDHKTSPLTEEDAKNVQRYRDMVMPAVHRMPAFDDATLNRFARYPIPKVLSTLSAAGVILTTPEFVKMLVEKMSPGTQVPEHILDTIVAMQGHFFDLFAEHPQLIEQLASTGVYDVSPKHVTPEIGVVAEKYLEKRSTISDYLSRQLIPPVLREDEPAWTDVATLTDPNTGASYQTTRGAIRDAHDQVAKKEMLRLAATGALLASGARVAAGALPTAARPLAYGATALLGAKHLRPDYGAHYVSDEGLPVPALTELQKVSSAADMLGSAALVTALGHDYDSRLRAGRPVHDPGASMGKRLLDRVGEYYSENPFLGTVGTLGALGALKKLSAYLEEDVASRTSDGVRLAEIDVDALVDKVAEALNR